MIRIDWLVPATYAKLLGDGTMSIIGGGVDTLVVSDLLETTSIGVVLAMRISGPAQEWREEHGLKIALDEGSGHEHTVVDEHLTIAEAPVLDPDREIAVLYPAECRWHPTRSGLVSLNVALDRECVQRVPFRLVDARGGDF